MVDPMCDYCRVEIEDTDHYLLYCPQHNDERELLKRNIRKLCKHFFSASLLLNPPTKIAVEIREELFTYITNTEYDKIL